MTISAFVDLPQTGEIGKALRASSKMATGSLIVDIMKNKSARIVEDS
jgi:hypothetical protein